MPPSFRISRRLRQPQPVLLQLRETGLTRPMAGDRDHVARARQVGPVPAHDRPQPPPDPVPRHGVADPPRGDEGPSWASPRSSSSKVAKHQKTPPFGASLGLDPRELRPPGHAVSPRNPHWIRWTELVAPPPRSHGYLPCWVVWRLKCSSAPFGSRRFRPFARRFLRIPRPALVAMRARKPC